MRLARMGSKELSKVFFFISPLTFISLFKPLSLTPLQAKSLSLTPLQAKPNHHFQIGGYFQMFYKMLFSSDKRSTIAFRHECGCKRNPIPNAPYTISNGTANKLTLAKFHAKLKNCVTPP